MLFFVEGDYCPRQVFVRRIEFFRPVHAAKKSADAARTLLAGRDRCVEAWFALKTEIKLFDSKGAGRRHRLIGMGGMLRMQSLSSDPGSWK
jgi:hypothetical protein